MNSLAIYFGTKLISVVEIKGKQLINYIRIPQSSISSSGELEEKVPNVVKTPTVIRNELEKNKIEAKEVTVTLSGKDLIVRTFEIPILPQVELYNAINFEARKYIPFKVEDLVSDFQYKKIDRYKRKNLVLFVGIKKETFNKYLSILNQLNLKITSIEYSAFSVLRLLKLARIRTKGIVCVINIDLAEEDEVNFMILENGFPLFSRDITLFTEFPQLINTTETSLDSPLEKLKKEIRISLDYYYRKFTAKKIIKTFSISGKDYQSDLAAFGKEIGLNIQFVDVNKCIDKPVSFSLGFIKSYSAALSKIIKTELQINLLLAKIKAAKAAAPSRLILSLVNLKVKTKVVILGLLMCIATLVYGFYRIIPLDKQLKVIMGSRPQISIINPTASYEEINTIDSEYKSKAYTMDNLINKQVYLTEVLEAICRVIPEGIYLSDISFKKEDNRTELILRGIAHAVSGAKELELVNQFNSNWKENSTFTKYFKELDISSLIQSQNADTNETVANFEILCRN